MKHSTSTTTSVVPGFSYRGEVWAHGSGGVVVDFDWFDSGGTLVSTSVGSGVVLDGESRLVDSVVDVPSGAVGALMRVRFVGTVESDVVWVESAGFSRVSLWPGVGLFGGFQTGFDASNEWGWFGSITGVGVGVVVDPGVGDGYSLEVTAGSGGWGVYSETVAGRLVVEEGVELSGVARVDLGEITGRAGVVSLDWLDSGGNVVSSSSGVPVEETGWVDLTVDAAAPATAVDVRLRVDISGTAVGETHSLRFGQVCRGGDVCG